MALLLCTWKGVRSTGSDKGFLLTDPSIHSKKLHFGLTDLGRAGIRAFFQGHECGKICRELGLEAKDRKDCEKEVSSN